MSDTYTHNVEVKNAAHRDYSEIVLDSQFEEFFDSITSLIATQCDAPVALITFVDKESIWIHSQVGFPNVSILPNKQRFCGIFPKDKEFFQILDTDLDDAHQAHMFMINGTKAKFYAAARIKLPLGEMIGVLCIFDTKKRVLSLKQRELLIGMAYVIEKALVTKSFLKRIS